MLISENLKKINEKIAEAAARANRPATGIKLVAVSKRFPASRIAEAFAAGQRVFGENYLQELQGKRPQLPPELVFHFIGHLQSNKAKIAAATCNMIETVDSVKLGRILDRHLHELDRTMDILVQVNIGDEHSKAGIPAHETAELVTRLNEFARLRVCGLMTMPPLVREPELARPYFRQLRELAEQLQVKGLFPGAERPELSMGMSSDFAIAIEEGATIIRIGTAIFGERDPAGE